MLWAVPAIAFGLALRLIFSSYQPFAYWGSDSESYFMFAYRALHETVLSISEKRRYIYPILLLPLSVLPGSVLQWLLLFQHAMGLLTLIPLAYCIRKIFHGWRVWMIPVTCLYAGMPVIIWYEHELLAEAFFFATFIWAMAAWFAWTGRIGSGCGGATGARPWCNAGRVIWWIFFACLALCVLTKPAGRFLWPGLVLGLIYVRAWRHLRWWHGGALAALLVASWTMGQGTQASRLLYSSVFPLTQLDSGIHPELKAEIAPLVRKSRETLDGYYLIDNEPKNFLSGGFRDGDFPAWQALAERGDTELFGAMRELALEAIAAEPHLYAYIAASRTVGSVNWTNFKLRRFEYDYFPGRFESLYNEMLRRGGRRAEMMQYILGRNATDPPLDFEEVRMIILPENRGIAAGWMQNYVEWMSRRGIFFAEVVADGKIRSLWEMWPTPLGWWLIAGTFAALAVPAFRSNLGVWLVIAVGYAVGVHLVGSSNPRFFALAWPPLLMALAVPPEIIWRAVASRWQPGSGGPRS